jgi:hypothetical protein
MVDSAFFKVPRALPACERDAASSAPVARPSPATSFASLATLLHVSSPQLFGSLSYPLYSFQIAVQALTCGHSLHRRVPCCFHIVQTKGQNIGCAIPV